MVPSTHVQAMVSAKIMDSASVMDPSVARIAVWLVLDQPTGHAITMERVVLLGIAFAMMDFRVLHVN